MTPTSPPIRAVRPDTLPRDKQSSQRNVGAGIAAVIGSLVLLIGVPIALVLLVGNPLPTSGPSRDWLTATIDPELVINVLAVLVWVVWMHFLVCFLSEWRAIRKGRMPDHVMFGGGSQLVARRLVAGILMLTGGLSMAQGFAAANAPEPGSLNPVDGVTAIATVRGDLKDAGMAAQEAKSESTPAATSAVQGTKHYEVVPPQGRHHDTMWDIAQRLLGDPVRYKEIYELNKNRMQPDGRRLTDADLIRPGWQLLLPADAKGPGVRSTPPPNAHLTPAVQGTPGAESRSTANAQSDGTTLQATVDSVIGSTSEESGVNLGEILLGGGLVLAGLVTALTARRGLFGTPGEQEGALRLAANPVRSDLLDRSLRILAETRRGQNLPMPDVSVVYLSDEKVIVHVVGEAEAPAHPWASSEDHSSWSVTAADLEGMTADAPAPFPALVNIADSHGYDVLVDLEYSSGLIAIGGDTQVAREVVMSSVVDLATHAWSDSVDVTMVGFGDDLAELAPQRVSTMSSLDEALADAEKHIGRASELLHRLGVGGVLSGRGTARHPELKPRVLVLSGAPSAEQVQRISALSTGGRTAFASLCVGDAPGARWRFVVDPAGHIDLGVLGVKGIARRFTLTANEEMKQLVRNTVKEAAERTTSVSQSAPAAFVGEGVAADSTARPARDAAVTVQLLGPVQVTAPGTAHGPTKDVLTELVVMAALHPQGLHEAVLRAGLWPRGVEDDVVASTLHDAQGWLGNDAAGNPRIAARDDGLWHLSDDVYVDWAELQSCAIPDGGSEAASCARGLALAQGEAFSGTPVGRYTWLAYHRAARDARGLITAMASRGAALIGKGDPRRAETALRNGLELVPASEVLWRDLIRLKSGGDPEGPSAVVGEMHRTLPDHRFEPETEALVAHLAPSVSMGRTS